MKVDVVRGHGGGHDDQVVAVLLVVVVVLLVPLPLVPLLHFFSFSFSLQQSVTSKKGKKDTKSLPKRQPDGEIHYGNKGMLFVLSIP